MNRIKKILKIYINYSKVKEILTEILYIILISIILSVLIFLFDIISNLFK